MGKSPKMNRMYEMFPPFKNEIGTGTQRYCAEATCGRINKQLLSVSVQQWKVLLYSFRIPILDPQIVVILIDSLKKERKINKTASLQRERTPVK